jgi:hypothetical protein
MTNTANHTPAPWAYDEETGRIYHADGDVEPTVAVVDLENASPGQAKADGCLIAAAPRMLAALMLAQHALNRAPRFRVGDTDSYKIATVVDRAIAGATTGKDGGRP